MDISDGLVHHYWHMSNGYIPLSQSMLRSSIWRNEDPETLKVWLTLLLIKDSYHVVESSIGALADLAKVPEEKTREAIGKFLAPDPDSLNQENEGRKLKAMKRGWLVLNGKFFQDQMVEINRRARWRRAKRNYRAKKVIAPEI